MTLLHDDRLFPSEPTALAIARRLYRSVQDRPILSPHGHTNPAWFRTNAPFPDPAKLFIQPDHYVHRMLYSQGISLESLEIDAEEIKNPRAVWRIFAENYFLFRATPTRLWLDFAFAELFGLSQRLDASTADLYFDTISEKLQTPEFLPRALYERFNIEVLATTDSPLDSLADHEALLQSGWNGRILPTFRPDAVVDPAYANFQKNLDQLGERSHEDTTSWPGYLAALRFHRERFRKLGATATDHGHPTAQTANLSSSEATALYAQIYAGTASLAQQELFRAQMLTEMARMSIDDGLVMQIHPGAYRNHNEQLFHKFGRDMGADIPMATNYVDALQPLLSQFGNDTRLQIILFTLDESAYSRELAPLAGHYPTLLLGPPWWFYDSPEGMMRYREQVTETAGFYNTAGFNDDTRAFLSIPARHDVARRADSAFLARLVSEHRLDEDEAFELIGQLTTDLVRKAYHLPEAKSRKR